MSGLTYRHQRVQRLRKLVGRRASREEERRFVIEGVNLLEEALSAGTAIDSVYVDSAWARRDHARQAEGDRPGERVWPGDHTGQGEGEPPELEGRGGPGGAGGFSGTGTDEDDRGDVAPQRLSALLTRCYDQGARLFELEEGVLARVAGTVTPQPVLAVAEMPSARLADLAPARLGLVVVCVDVRDPGNAGTVARTAWAAGADALVCSQGTVDMWNPKTVRASAGAVLHLPVVNAGPAADVLDELGRRGLARWGTVVKGGQDYAVADLCGPVALVLGNEASGLPLGQLEPHLDGLVSIPMAGGAESLNVSTAAAVLCFEAVRQRRLGRMVDGNAGRTI